MSEISYDCTDSESEGDDESDGVVSGKTASEINEEEEIEDEGEYVHDDKVDEREGISDDGNGVNDAENSQGVSENKIEEEVCKAKIGEENSDQSTSEEKENENNSKSVSEKEDASIKRSDSSSNITSIKAATNHLEAARSNFLKQKAIFEQAHKALLEAESAYKVARRTKNQVPKQKKPRTKMSKREVNKKYTNLLIE